jgi:hypothetical protein
MLVPSKKTEEKMITTFCKESAKYFIAPGKTALELRKASLEEKGTWGEALKARALFIAQAIVSIVAVPLALLALIFVAPLVLCTEGKEAAHKLLKELSFTILGHITTIPTALLAAVVPHSLKWQAPASQAVQCFKSCFGLQQQQ